MSEDDIQGMEDVMEFAMLDERAKEFSHTIEYAVDGSKTEQQHYVSSLNCNLASARDDMMMTKFNAGKMDGVSAYHGIQSFKPGEVTPDVAHEIGKKLAQELWGDRFEVVIATHLNKEHIHTHFVLNSVSFKDGLKFYDNKKTYAKMRQVSDRLCREYGLSVIEQSGHSKSKQYAEWQAEKKGEPTYRAMIKDDVDAAIRESMTERQFFDNLRKKGYQIKQGQDITVRHIGRQRGLKLYRNFGDSYTIEAIRERILAQDRPERAIIPAKPPPKQARFKGSKISKVKMTGLKALYFYYLYRLGYFPKKRQPNPKRVYFLFREDIRHIQNISKETRLLVKHNIETDEQLGKHKEGLSAQIKSLCVQRKKLRNQERQIANKGNPEAIKAQIAEMTEKLKELRGEAKHCENIEKRSADIKTKLQQARKNEKIKEQEVRANDQFRRRG
jgi:hypothetical protein